MTATNQHSFHNQRLLQNARAFPPNYYAQLSNHLCVNKRILVSSGEMVPLKITESKLYMIPETALPHLPSFWYEEETAQPVAVKPSNTAPVANSGKSRMVWRRGHGTIEKVDRLTGEIMHLVEEFIDKNNRMQPQTIC